MSSKLESPSVCLFDDATDEGLSLPEHVREVYGGDWAIPAAEDATYVYSNFVVSHDGRISFNEPEHYGGGDVNGGNPFDLWLMALLRARADAVMVGDNTLKLEPEHVWTHQYIFPDDTALFHELRQAEGRSTYPLQVFLSIDGQINWDAAVFSSPDYHVVIATTKRGEARVGKEARAEAKVDVIAQDHAVVDLRELTDTLRRDFDVRTLLIEGGPRAYGSAITDRIIRDEFLTLSPIVVGNDSAEGKIRPGLLDGAAFSPGNALQMIPLSLKRHGNHMFLRSRCVYPDA